MARRNYFELIQDMGFDADKEFEIISKLISEKIRLCPSISFRNVLNGNFLLYLKYRKIQFTSYDEVNEYFKNNMNGIERLFSYVEFIIDLYFFLKEKRLLDYNFSEHLILDKYNEIENRISYSLDKTNHKLITLDNGNRIIVEKNVYASEVSQILSETNIQEAIKVLEYNHFSNKGDIQRKKEILITLANYLEPLRKELNNSEELKEVFKVNNQKIIAFEKLFEMYNNFGLRHNNAKQYHLDMTNEKLEQWYDDIYTSSLFVILSLDEARILSELTFLREE
ncbi:hypothetical protein [Streptococcus cristatus]|uniref:hypothetical protein n=1 Tax=Streptococcus cristatus TaxID=45634 RepID=UPI002283DA52|nr:hypothetical protein [Streptococcus cristatus]MCY7217129.1 hypothetical protein [Streptococcus cristatus]